MEHTAQLRIVAHDAQTVTVRLAVMHDDRQIQLERKLQLRAEHPFLLCLCGCVPVIIQPDLADGADLRLRCQRADMCEAAVRPAVGLLRMPADGGIDKIMRLCQRNGALRRDAAVAGVDHERDTAVMHGAQHLVAVGVELSAVVMRVGVKKLCHSA